MSSSLAGKFQDHYSILGVDYKATPEALQTAYARLAEKYGSSNSETANPEKFESVSLAFEVLSDPGLRREFDKLKGIGQDEGTAFSGVDFFEHLGRGADLRLALLCLLYDRRRGRSLRPSLSLRQLEGMLEATAEEVNFALWYLKQRNRVVVDDKSSLQISVEGMDFLENCRPTADVIMPLIKADAVAEGKAQTHKSAPSPSAAGSVRDAMNKLRPR